MKKDILGNIEPSLLISGVERYLKGEVVEIRYFISSMAVNAPECKGTIEKCVSTAKLDGYEITEEKKDGFGLTIIRMQHTETAKALLVVEKMQKEHFKNATACFVRFGTIPKSGRSKNHCDGLLEDGVSVYRALRVGQDVKIMPGTNQELCGMIALKNERQCYIVTGKEVGTGSDGEPILANARIWRKVTNIF